MMQLPILPCAEKLESLQHQKHELKPTNTVRTENGPILAKKSV